MPLPATRCSLARPTFPLRFCARVPTSWFLFASLPSSFSPQCSPNVHQVKGVHLLFRCVALISPKTNDQEHKDDGKNRRLPSLKLIYVTIIFNNAKRVTSNPYRVVGVARACCGWLSLLLVLPGALTRADRQTDGRLTVHYYVRSLNLAILGFHFTARLKVCYVRKFDSCQVARFFNRDIF